jgi:pimeloyl-ACP methyl ester carboxylesterase
MNMRGASLKTVDVNGTQLHYMEFGQNNKQSVIFTPAAFTDYRVWQFQVEPFSHHYRVITYSRRHSYPNEMEENFHFTAENSGIHQYAHDLAELIRKLNLTPVHLVGHSDGAFVTLYCACKNPSLVKSLVLGEPAVLPILASSQLEEDRKMFQDFWENAIKPAAEAFRRGEFENGTRIFMDGAMSKGYFDQLPKPIRESMMDNAKAFLKQAENPMPMDFNIEELQKISSLPTLFVKGELSPKFLHRIVDILAQQLPKSEQVTIQGVTHDLGRANEADLFNSKVIEFLARN